MKKTYPVSKSAREWWKHLKWKKRVANKSTRKIFRLEIRQYIQG